MKNYIIAYDIMNVKRLQKVKKIVYAYALGGQKSAREAPLDKNCLKRLVGQLMQIVEKNDKINIISVLNNPILLGKAKQTIMKENGIIIL